MSYLIFCSFEVGGLPYKMAEILNRHRVEAYYVSLHQNAAGHDSSRFHHGEQKEKWDLSPLFKKEYWPFDGSRKLLARIKNKYGIDYCLATGHRSYLLKDAGIDYGYWSYGADFDQFQNWSLRDFCVERRRFVPAKYPFWKKIIAYMDLLLRSPREQKASINRADSVMIVGYQLQTYKHLFPSKKFFYFPHIVSVPDYGDLRAQKAQNKRSICGEIGANRFFFSASRHLWLDRNRGFPDYKGNDVIIRSFARYLAVSRDKGSKLILAAKGPDVNLTKGLVRALGIEDYVVWKEEMPKNRLISYYQGASLCFGQFGLPMLSYAVIEPLANGCPTISYTGESRNTELPFYDTLPPIFNSKDAEEIARFMNKIVTNGDYESDLAYKSWLWAKENCSEEVFVKCFQSLIT